MAEQSPIRPEMFRANPVKPTNGMEALESLSPSMRQLGLALAELMDRFPFLTSAVAHIGGANNQSDGTISLARPQQDVHVRLILEGTLCQESLKPKGTAYASPGKGIFLRKLPDGSLIVPDKSYVKEGQIVCYVVGEFFKIVSYPLQIEAPLTGEINFVSEDGSEIKQGETLFHIDSDSKPV